MRMRKYAMVLAAVVLPISTVVLLEGTAFAGKVTGSGTTSCHFGGTISFNPPLTSAGSPTTKKEVTTVSATLSGCTGGTPVGPSTTATIKAIKTKTPKGTNGGTCASFTSNSSKTTLKVTVKWAGEKPSKFSVVGLNPGANEEGELGFTGSFPVSGSYAGTGSVAAYLTTASSNAIATCSGSISSLSLDSTTSTGTI